MQIICILHCLTTIGSPTDVQIVTYLVYNYETSEVKLHNIILWLYIGTFLDHHNRGGTEMQLRDHA